MVKTKQYKRILFCAVITIFFFTTNNNFAQEIKKLTRNANKCDDLAASNFDDTRVGIGVHIKELQKNPVPAIEACRTAIEKLPNDRLLLFQLARALQMNSEYFGAEKFYTKAHNEGHPMAHVNLSLMYSFGRGVSADYEKAKRLAAPAAINRYAPAEYAMGQAFHFDKSDSKNLKLAIVWYRRSAANGFTPANIALMHLEKHELKLDTHSSSE